MRQWTINETAQGGGERANAMKWVQFSLIFALILASCASGPTPLAELAIATAVAQTVAAWTPTATAPTDTPIPTNTEVPTDTPPPSNTPENPPVVRSYQRAP